MAGPVSLDTNCILRWALRDIPEQAEAVDRLIRTEANISIEDMAIWEAVYVLELQYKLPRPIVAGHIESVLALGNVNCNKDMFQQALPIYQAHSSLSFTDVCLAIYAQLNDALPLCTFDKKLSTQLDQVRLLK